MLSKDTDQTKHSFMTYKKKPWYDADFDLPITKILIYFTIICAVVSYFEKVSYFPKFCR